MVMGALLPGAITGVIDLAKQVLGRWIPDTAARDEASAALAMALQQADLISLQGQIDIDKIEAASGSLFQAGARPAILWICAAGLGWQYIIGPAIVTAQALYHGVPPPAVDMSGLFPLLMGMLGLGAMRTYERVNGVAAGQGPASRAAAVAPKK